MPTWVRVRDDSTGAVYDVEERSVRAGMTVLTGYPKVSGLHARPRPTKYPPIVLRTARGRVDVALTAPDVDEPGDPAGDLEPAHTTDDPSVSDDQSKERDRK